MFVQIRQRLAEMILRGNVAEGEALPSARQIAADLSVNPLTVTKAFDALVDIGVVEKRRGLGMFVKPGARAELLTHERDQFVKQDWPRIAAQIKTLDLDLKSLLTHANDQGRSHE
ncbi:MAG: GntR family transcriptional regulator [Candidatus Devosia euplotis]|nr:GntR family transcriptional regulator [Candidatus Devosia euplotis]